MTDGHGGLVLEEVIEQRRVSRQGEVHVLADLAGERRPLLDEVPPVSDFQLQCVIRRLQRRFTQSEPGRGRPVLAEGYAEISPPSAQNPAR